MKQFFLSVLVLFFSLSVVTAQVYKKQLKEANKSLGKYLIDPIGNKAAMEESLALINQLLEADDAKADPIVWNTKGDLYTQIAKAEMNKKVLDPEFVITTPDAGLKALESFEKAISIATKKGDIKDALTGIRETEDNLNNIGITQFQDQDYNGAFKNFSASIKASDILVANKQDTRLAVDSVRNDQVFYTGVCAYYGENKEASIPYFEALYTGGKAQSLVYEALFNMYSEKDVDKAMTYLDAGRKAHPDDNGLLFSEINYYLKVGKLDILTEKLKTAIAKEPDNVSVYTTLGNVYDQLNQKERTAGNEAKADEYFDLAFDYFSQGLAKDPSNFDATYSQGALYYNKAAGMTTMLNELSNDYSAAGTKKYNDIKAKMDGYFGQALPFFLKAEQIDGTDVNTMIALKEIYARKGDLEKSKEYKMKMEAAGN